MDPRLREGDGFFAMTYFEIGSKMFYSIPRRGFRFVCSLIGIIRVPASEIKPLPLFSRIQLCSFIRSKKKCPPGGREGRGVTSSLSGLKSYL